MSFYLGPGHPLTVLQSFADVEAAAQGGLLVEHQWVELKEGIGPSSVKTNVELAKDLASLSLDGGLLIFGVQDKTYEVVGCDDEGLTSRISQVAVMRIQPPLSPVIHRIESDEGRVVLVVVVPASSTAPHMVDNSYWGRSSDGKMKLSDAQVRSLIEGRVQSRQGFSDRLRAMVDDDPLCDMLVEGRAGSQGHLYVLAEPTTPVMGDAPVLRGVLNALPLPTNTSLGDGLARCTSTARHPDGQACSNWYGSEPVGSRFENALLWAILTDDYRLQMVSGGASAEWETPGGRGLFTLTRHVSLVIWQFLAALQETAKTMGFTGEWSGYLHDQAQGKCSIGC